MPYILMSFSQFDLGRKDNLRIFIDAENIPY